MSETPRLGDLTETIRRTLVGEAGIEADRVNLTTSLVMRDIRAATGAERDAQAQLAWRLRNLHALYAERQNWVGFEHARRDAWREMAENLKPLLALLAPNPSEGR